MRSELPGTPLLSLTRVRQVFRFLKAFAERSLPVQRRIGDQPFSLRLAELPKHPSISVGEVYLVRPGEDLRTGEQLRDDDSLLRVRRPRLTPAPSPPSLVEEWLLPGWDGPEGSIEVVPTRNVNAGLGTETVLFAADVARAQALGQWRARWEKWAMDERPARTAMRVFERLFELRGRIELDGERLELMLGDGRLRWKTTAGEVDHPILLQRVELEFDPDVPEIRVVDADRPPELYGAVLHDGEGVSADVFQQLRRELEEGGYHPLSKEATSAYLRRLVQRLSPRGTFSEGALDNGDEETQYMTSEELDDRVDRHLAFARGPSADPAMVRDPTLFLRARITGFAAAFQRVLDDLERTDVLPVSLQRLVGVEPPVADDDPPPPQSPWSEPAEILLSKPANPEQIAIVRALERHRAVLVQGPPGTGKSHTIANLIGHLVAHGKRVLVTSHTTKALRVLRGQVVEPLQPLCVAVLDNDLEARAQMEQSVRGILSRLTSAHEESLVREVETLTESRASLNADIESLTADLRAVREAEYLPIIVAGVPTAPSDAARWVQEMADGNDWIPGPLEAGATLPLDTDELVELYGINAELTEADEAELAEGLPDLSVIPGPEAFSDIVRALNVHRDEDLERFWSRPSSPEDLPVLERLTLIARRAAADLVALERWQRNVVAAGHSGGVERDLWISLRDLLRDASARWELARPVVLEHAPEVYFSTNLDESSVFLEEIVLHLKSGGSLRGLRLFFKPKWRAAIQRCRVNGQAPSTIEHFQALSTHLDLVQRRDALRVRWIRQAEPVGLPAFDACGHPPEPVLAEYAKQIEPLLEWWNSRWSEISERLAEASFVWEEFRACEMAKAPPATAFERDASLLAGPLSVAIGNRLTLARREEAHLLLRGLKEQLDGHRGRCCTALAKATRDRNPVAYETAYAALNNLAARQTLWRRRTALLTKLSAVAPGWATAIRHRVVVHGAPQVPGEAVLAWRWRQLSQEIERRAGLDEVRLTERLHQRRDQLREITADVIDRRAWLAQLRRTDLAARQALQGWADTQRRIGRGTGKRVPELQARARELLVQARDAVPVWIMPLNRVADGFDPRHVRFDVVIVDEASQSDMTGLLCWYLGERVAVVGDHEQVSPLAVGEQTEATQGLINEHLSGIPNNHLYDGRMSIYHLARMSFGGTIALREHFRCVPDIIEFSNQLSYDGEIKALRNPATAPRPHVVEYVVKGFSQADRLEKANRAEARVVAALVKAVCELPEYQGRTLGAITLLGDEQADLIQDLTVVLLGAVELDRRRFVAGNAAQFQGDERSVMFLSLVDVPVGAPLALRQAELFKQRYNVAASRAKDQLWVVHSLDPARDLKSGDLRRRLIEHARDPSARQQAVDRALRRAESPFEQAVIERLAHAGYRVEPQVVVGRHRIDMIVGDGEHRVALECDGDRHHGVDQIPADMARQAILERAGWRFVRVRGTRFFGNPRGTMEWVFEQLGRLGVHPDGLGGGVASLDEGSDEFRERVIRRAHEIMREQGWLPVLGETAMKDRGSS